MLRHGYDALFSRTCLRGKRHCEATKCVSLPGLGLPMNDTPWTTINTLPIARTARYRFPGGVSRSVSVQLAEDRFVVYSPGRALAESATEFIGADADVQLVVPSVGHTLGLETWCSAFPNATVLATAATAERLQRVKAVTGVHRHTEDGAALSNTIAVALPPTAKTGELWLRVADDNAVHWLVCDAYMNIAALAPGRLLRLAQRLYGLRVGLDVGRAFRTGLSDKARFVAWVGARFSDPHRHVLVPCHGEIDDAPQLGARINAVTRSRLGRER